MAAGVHFENNLKKKSWVLIWNGEICIRKWFSVIQNGRRQPFCEFFKKTSKLYIDLKWREMRSKVIFGHPKWPKSDFQNGHRRPFWKKIQKQSWILIWNGEKCIRKWFSVIQNVRRSHFVKFKKKTSKLRIDLKWREMWLKAIFGHPKWQLAAILWRKKSCILIWNGEKCDQKPFCEK